MSPAVRKTAAAPAGGQPLQWDFPVLEYRPFREYGTRQTFAAFVQLGLASDHPISAVVVGQPEVAAPALQTRAFGCLRIFFDGRRYF